MSSALIHNLCSTLALMASAVIVYNALRAIAPTERMGTLRIEDTRALEPKPKLRKFKKYVFHYYINESNLNQIGKQ